jgi:hypothetical protein
MDGAGDRHRLALAARVPPAWSVADVDADVAWRETVFALSCRGG